MPASLAPANELPKAAAHEPKLMAKRPVEAIRRRAVKGVSYARTPIRLVSALGRKRTLAPPARKRPPGHSINCPTSRKRTGRRGRAPPCSGHFPENRGQSTNSWRIILTQRPWQQELAKINSYRTTVPAWPENSQSAPEWMRRLKAQTCRGSGRQSTTLWSKPVRRLAPLLRRYGLPRKPCDPDDRTGRRCIPRCRTGSASDTARPRGCTRPTLAGSRSATADELAN